MSAEAWYASAAIGVAASLGGMVWAFRRGVLGVIANFTAGVGGALVGEAVSRGSPYSYPEHILRGPAIPGIPAPAGPLHLFFSAVGAIAALIILHVAWAGLLAWRGRQAPAR